MRAFINSNINQIYTSEKNNLWFQQLTQIQETWS